MSSPNAPSLVTLEGMLDAVEVALRPFADRSEKDLPPPSADDYCKARAALTELQIYRSGQGHYNLPKEG